MNVLTRVVRGLLDSVRFFFFDGAREKTWENAARERNIYRERGGNANAVTSDSDLTHVYRVAYESRIYTSVRRIASEQTHRKLFRIPSKVICTPDGRCMCSWSRKNVRIVSLGGKIEMFYRSIGRARIENRGVMYIYATAPRVSRTSRMIYSGFCKSYRWSSIYSR